MAIISVNTWESVLDGLTATQGFGAKIGKSISPGDLIWLNGDLGAGKTTLTKSIAVAVGISSDVVTSPTFTLVHEYRGGRIPIYHFDLYRLNGPRDLDNLGFDDYLAADDGVVIVEWANKAYERLPTDSLLISLATVPDSVGFRRVFVKAGGERSAALLSRIREACGC